MHLEITSPGMLETKSILGTNEKFTVVPQFFGNGRAANALLIKTYDGANNSLRTYLVEISGTNGKLSLIDRTAPVQPRIDAPKKAADAGKTVTPVKK